MTFGQGKIWMDGELVDWANANIHIMSHVVHYGSGVFEGIRCYDTALQIHRLILLRIFLFEIYTSRNSRTQ